MNGIDELRSEAGGEESEWIEALCLLHPLSPRILQMYPPLGKKDSHEIDALVIVTKDGDTRRVAVETTRCFQGPAAKGGAFARSAESVFNEVCSELEISLSTRTLESGFRADVEIVFSEELDRLLSPLPSTRRNQREFHRTLAILRAELVEPVAKTLQTALGCPGIACDVDIAPIRLNHLLDSVRVRAWPRSVTRSVSVSLRRLVVISEGMKSSIATMSRLVGIDFEGLQAAAHAKLRRADEYRADATRLGATRLWLLLIAEGTSAVDLLAFSPEFVYAFADRLRALLGGASEGRCQFEEIYLLARTWYATDFHDVMAESGKAEQHWTLFSLCQSA